MTAQDAKPDNVLARSETTAANTAETERDVRVLRSFVECFDIKVRRDLVLGPIFEARITGWTPLLDRMAAFWSSVAPITGRCSQPVLK